MELRGDDPAALEQGRRPGAAPISTADPQIIELEDNRTSPGIEWNFTVDRVDGRPLRRRAC